MKNNFPFSAILGQDELLLGIILNIINPNLGGFLIKGVKGTGKSTAVYATPDIIPEIQVLANCEFNCDPQKPDEWCNDCRKRHSSIKKEVLTKPIKNVHVPLSITEESLLGDIDVELLLKKGEKRFIAGILAKAHRQILYIDEVNLLPDHITDDILDVAAMGWNQIEREGFSLSHPSRFLLIGTMNPEEGELRPQILDRFPLSVNVSSVIEPTIRKEIILRNLAYEKEPKKFCNRFQQANKNLKQQIKLSRNFLQHVKVKPEFYHLVVNLGAEKQVDGHRADITIIKTAQTHAAFEMRDQVNLRHIKQAARFVLGHRTREGGLSKPLTMDEIDEYFANLAKGKLRTNKEKNNQKFSLFSQGDLIQPEKK